MSAPVFIVGLPRSGTTLLQSALVNTGKFSALPETHFYSYLTKGLNFPLQPKGHAKLEHRHRAKTQEPFPVKRLNRVSAKKDLFLQYVDTFKCDNKKRLLEKTPRHVFHIPEILNLFPDAKIIALIREPKNTISSLLNMEAKKTKSVIRFCRLYNHVIAALKPWTTHDQVLCIRYEDLLDSSDSTFKKVFSFLGINDAGTISVRASDEIIRSSENWKSNNKDLGAIRPNDPLAWKKRITFEQAELIDSICARYSEQWHYAADLRLRNPLRFICAAVKDLARQRSAKEIFKLVFSP